MSLGEHIRKQRKKQKLSAEALAKLCGISRSYITLIENGMRLPGKKVIPKLAEALQVKRSLIVNWYLEDIRKKLE